MPQGRSKNNASATKPPSVISDVALALERVETLRKVCVELIETTEPSKRAHLLTMIAILGHVGDGASDGA